MRQGAAATSWGGCSPENCRRRLSQPVIVENRPGGSEITATELLARSNPDGYTLAVLSNALSINEASPQSKKYDIARDLAPIARRLIFPSPC
jgi:tripartite-type tricarboxylate transporter receptor subunit TctC